MLIYIHLKIDQHEYNLAKVMMGIYIDEGYHVLSIEPWP